MAFFCNSKSKSLYGFVCTWILIQMFSYIWTFYMVPYIEVCSALSFYFTGFVSQFSTMPPVLMVQYKYYKCFIFIIWCLWRRSGQLAKQGACTGYDVKLSWSDADWLSKQRLFMHVLCSGAGNKKMLSFCCTPLKATLHTIAAKSLPNWIIQSSPIAALV